MKNSQDMENPMGVMQESMLKMHEQMHKIIDAENLQERERLMQEHREMLHQHMQAMKGGETMGQGMRGDDAKNG